MGRRKTTKEFKKQVFEWTAGTYEVLGEYQSSASKILMRHTTCGCEWWVRPNSFQQGNRCPKCHSQAIKTQAQFEQEIRTLHGEEYSVLGQYINSSSKVLLRHNLCMREWEVTPNNFSKRGNCPFCTGKRPRSTEDYKWEVEWLTSGEYVILGEYERSVKPVLTKHLLCGHEWLTSPSNFLQGKRCPKCHTSAPKTTEEIEERVRNLTNGEYRLCSSYRNANTKVAMEHLLCGHVWEVVPAKFFQVRRCPKCSKRGRKAKTTEEFRTNIVNLVGSEYVLLNDYQKCNQRVLFRHEKCGTDFEMVPSVFLTGGRCPNCR